MIAQSQTPVPSDAMGAEVVPAPMVIADELRAELFREVCPRKRKLGFCAVELSNFELAIGGRMSGGAPALPCSTVFWLSVGDAPTARHGDAHVVTDG
jgi:hypothetical protein